MPGGKNNTDHDVDGKELQSLYDAVSSKFDVGTLEDFTSNMDSPEKRQRFYKVVSVKFDLGDYNSFENRLKKKENAATSAPSSTSSVSSVSKESEKSNVPDILERNTSYPSEQVHLRKTEKNIIALQFDELREQLLHSVGRVIRQVF